MLPRTVRRYASAPRNRLIIIHYVYVPRYSVASRPCNLLTIEYFTFRGGAHSITRRARSARARTLSISAAPRARSRICMRAERIVTRFVGALEARRTPCTYLLSRRVYRQCYVETWCSVTMQISQLRQALRFTIDLSAVCLKSDGRERRLNAPRALDRRLYTSIGCNYDSNSIITRCALHTLSRTCERRKEVRNVL